MNYKKMNIFFLNRSIEEAFYIFKQDDKNLTLHIYNISWLQSLPVFSDHDVTVRKALFL